LAALPVNSKQKQCSLFVYRNTVDIATNYGGAKEGRILGTNSIEARNLLFVHIQRSIRSNSTDKGWYTRSQAEDLVCILTLLTIFLFIGLILEYLYTFTATSVLLGCLSGSIQLSYISDKEADLQLASSTDFKIRQP
jgi:hypothetical protein